MKKVILYLKKILLRIRYYILFRKEFLFSAVIKEQNADVKKIPVIIISFNQLYYLKKLISFLKSHSFKNIVIIDNNSNYPPLLNFLKEIEEEVRIYRLDENLGHRVLWKKKDLFQYYSKGYYVVTDPDVIPVKECPYDFIEVFKKILDKNGNVAKVGFSLKIDDIPSTNKNKKTILNWENQFWKQKDNNGNYISKIDTTFALYRPRSIPPITGSFFKAIRTKYPYTAKHGGWYIDSENLTEEQAYYLKNTDKSSSWLKLDSDGSPLKYKKYD
tara:strand:- start:220 stop:1035 length:816 start_codon:yes stop_codon:yes gene_type:complete